MTSFFAFKVPSSFQPYLDTFHSDPESLPTGAYEALWKIEELIVGIWEMQEEMCQPLAHGLPPQLSFQEMIDENKNRIAELIVEYLEKYTGSNGHRPQQYTFPPQMQPLITCYEAGIFPQSSPIYSDLTDLIIHSEDLIDLHHSLAVLESDPECSDYAYNKESMEAWIEDVQEKLDSKVSKFLAQYV